MFFDTPSMPALLSSIIPFLVLDVVAGNATTYYHHLPPDSASITIRRSITFRPSTNDHHYLEYAFLVICAVVNGLVKLSVLSLYRRIFVVDKHWRDPRNFFMLFMVTLIGMWTTSYTFAFVFMCRIDVQVLFTDPESMIQKCVNTLMFAYSYSISDFISDVLIILIPIPFVSRHPRISVLNLPIGRTLAVMGVFLLAWMAWNQKVGFVIITTELYWMILEITLGVLAACLPTLRGLLKSRSVGSVVKSVRSLFTIRSGSSTGSLGNTKEVSPVQIFGFKQATVTMDSNTDDF
ncbi:hypothetical protein K469DRAFT_725367 [Zopfia rhizophila CBS 207.26]|uniref:Rhodopsin domain-containing protein n=1 Tax=Zopfia rhizophila CBS 207.26 TaxID=1314779 RepID=A0A6A6E5X6_9PEZI|nr:hypothetical protein K469DRAFT_725367 [Zopfia rhizophila CBS 207.26]